MESYPEHNKMLAVKERSQEIGEFIEWLSSQGCLIGRYDRFNQMWPVMKSTNELLADYFDIDLDVIATETQEMYEALRANSKVDYPNV